MNFRFDCKSDDTYLVSCILRERQYRVPWLPGLEKGLISKNRM